MLTSKQIKRLNQARDILDALEETAAQYDRSSGTSSETWEIFTRGRLAELADTAADAIFDVLNHGNASQLIPMTEEQLFNRKEEVTS